MMRQIILDQPILLILSDKSFSNDILFFISF